MRDNKLITQNKIGVISITIIWLSISFFYLFFALNVWPPLDGDALSYIPPIFQYANNRKLVNSIWAPIKIFDPQGEGRLVYHGFLYQMIVGSFVPSPTHRGIIFIIAILNIITLGCLSFIFYRFISIAKISSFWKIAITGSALLSISTLIYGLIGRPDTFAILILSLLIGALITTDKQRHWIFFGLAIGILACSCTVAAILLSVAFIIYLSIRFNRKQLITYSLLSLVLTSAVMSMCFLWYPYNLLDWIEGNYKHFLSAVMSYWKRSILLYWFIIPYSFLFGVIFIVALSCALYLYSCFKSLIKIKWLFFCSIFILLVLIYWFGIRVPTHSYNIRLFAPLIYAVIIYSYVFWEGSNLGRQKYKKMLIRIGLLTIFILCAFGFLREIVLFQENTKSGMSYNKARYLLENFRAHHKGLIMLSSGLFTLTENYNNIVVSIVIKEEIDKFNPDYIILQQVYLKTLFPPEIPGFMIIEDFYSKTVPRLFGIKIANVNRGYSFAIYRKKSQF